ncbi:hypothetical protein [Hymenobacter swuensis]|uniref:Lipoprotein n=1 Tax=Hymenobacter swuensis DY53 TaxID=1227739 RepID=W8F4E4_9BACT|nr:hypothetical protein [Hymenobacter swuensis]AHJ96640.1 hypothetical protein Hsw_1045 [Hymenobacter swuensis DY53]
MGHRYIIILCLLGSLGLGSCKSTEKAVYRTIRSNNSVALGRLPKLEAVVEPGPLVVADDAHPDDASKVFRQELAYHLAEAVDDSLRYGYAKLLVTRAEQQRTGRVLQAFQMLTLMTPSLLGIPLEWYRTEVQAEIQIIDAHGEVIGTYSGTGRSKVRVAMYHGYSQSKAARLSDVQGLRMALDQIRPKLDADSDTLRQQLVGTGPVQEIIGSAEVK